MAEYKFDNPYDFEKVIKLQLERKIKGSKAELAPKNTKGYDIILFTGKKKYAVQVKNYKKQVISQPAIRKFHDFLEQPHNKEEFHSGIFITTTSFAKTVYSYLTAKGIENIILGFYDIKSGKIKLSKNTFMLTEKQKDSKNKHSINKKAKYIGVFTSKGGVGKTTISAHLAGAFALSGYENIILLDMDIQGNLRKLLGEGVFIPEDSSREYNGSTISVFDYSGEEWGEEDADIIICDCNPEFEKNASELVKKFDYCIIPITLNPLGINKNADVVQRTFDKIRKINKNAELFVLINNYHPHGQNKTKRKRNQCLNALLKSNFKKLMEKDSKCYYIDPLDDFAIRYSQSLLYWGYETLIEKCDPCLAFKEFAGISNPKADFISLAGYIEEHTNIAELKS